MKQLLIHLIFNWKLSFSVGKMRRTRRVLTLHGQTLINEQKRWIRVMFLGLTQGILEAAQDFLVTWHWFPAFPATTCTIEIQKLVNSSAIMKDDGTIGKLFFRFANWLTSLQKDHQFENSFTHSGSAGPNVLHRGPARWTLIAVPRFDSHKRDQLKIWGRKMRQNYL